MRRIFLPLIPPFSFVQETPSRTPCAKGLPTSEVMPVRSKMPPTLISPPPAGAWARAAAAAQRTKSAVRMECMGLLLESVRERIQPEIVADAPPAGGEPVGLEDEEQHDGDAEDAELERREELDERGELPGERA